MGAEAAAAVCVHTPVCIQGGSKGGAGLTAGMKCNRMYAGYDVQGFVSVCVSV